MREERRYRIGKIGEIGDEAEIDSLEKPAPVGEEIKAREMTNMSGNHISSACFKNNIFSILIQVELERSNKSRNGKGETKKKKEREGGESNVRQRERREGRGRKDVQEGDGGKKKGEVEEGNVSGAHVNI